LELNYSQKLALGFGGTFLVAGIVLSTLVFPFWNLIREDVYEDVEILTNDNGVCYVETLDSIPKTIENCTLQAGDKTTIKFGEGLAWATIVNP
jgi:ABC-type phosphate transport system permease subunit